MYRESKPHKHTLLKRVASTTTIILAKTRHTNFYSDTCKMHIKIAQFCERSDPASADSDSSEFVLKDESSKLPYKAQLKINVSEQDRSAGDSLVTNEFRLAVVGELSQKREAQRSDMPHFARLAVTQGHVWRYLHVWSCCNCGGLDGLTTATPSCPGCGHYQCANCYTESILTEKLLR